jgi:prepilin-type N-terminal cleavage/methylation domain-containing protein
MKKTNIQKGFTIIEVLLVIFLLAILALITFKIFANVTSSNVKKQNTAFTTATQLHQSKLSDLAQAKKYNKQIMADVALPDAKIINNSERDAGCELKRDTDEVGNFLWWGAQCIYNLNVTYQSSGDTRQDIKNLVTKFTALSWQPVSATQGRYLGFENDPTYYGAFPLSYHNQPSKSLYPTSSAMYLITNDSGIPGVQIADPSADMLYKTLMDKYASSTSYIYGYTLTSYYYLKQLPNGNYQNGGFPANMQQFVNIH